MVFGGSGSGKSSYVYEKVLAQAKEQPDKMFFVVVPEQFTMQTQRELVSRQEQHSIMNVDVVSFPRLAYRIFDELGLGNIKILEETGKNLVLRRVAEEQQENLKLIKASMKKTGYITEVKSVISELTQYRILPEQLDTFVEDERQSPLFRYKIADIQTMYQGFQDFLKDRFITAEELLEVLAEEAHRSKLLKNAAFVLDGFTGFTPVQYYLLEELMKIADEILVTAALDEREDPYQCDGIQDLFYMTKKTVENLGKIAERTHTEVVEPYWTHHGNHTRFRESEALLCLEQNLFRQNPIPFSKKTKDISMFSLLSPRQELHFIAREMKRLVREENYRYKDMAVVCGDVEMYGNYVREIFERYDIPVFLDTKKNIVFHPMTEFLKRALQVLEQDFSYESVIGYLRSGLSGFNMEETDLLENYLLAGGIRGWNKWQRKWVRRAGTNNEEELEQVNALRERLIEQFTSMREVFQKKTNVTEKSKAFYQFMVNLQIEEQLQEYSKRFEEEGETALAKEYVQIYRIVMDLLDKMVELLGEEQLTLREYREILEAGLEAAAVGIIPPGYDRVIFGDIERSRLSDIKVLFFVGVNDGIIPKATEHGGIISQSDREWFAQNEMELAPTDRERSFIQKFYLYLNLTKPSQKLYVTWFRVNSEGKETRKSYLVGILRKMFPKVQPVKVEQVSGMEQIVTPESSMDFFVQGLRMAKHGDILPEWKELYQWYAARDEWSQKAADFLAAAFYQYHPMRMGKEITRALYGKVLENSVTRLEQFSTCAYSHFLQYGLKLEERNLGEFAAVDMGSMFHEALQRYSVAMEKAGYHWFDVPKEAQEKLIQQAVEETVSMAADTVLLNDARTAYLVERIRRILKRTIETIANQIETSHFSPEGYEISFSFAEDLQAVNFSLNDEEKMRLKGRIDRVDTKKTDQQVYVKVVDYKSGNRDFQLLSLYHGLQLQLVVYMNSALELLKKKYPDKEVVPGGMYYYHLDDPVVEGTSNQTEIEIKEKILEELKLKGVAAEEADDSVSKKSQKAEKEEFQVLSNFVNHKIRDIGQKIFDGDIETNPYQLGDKTGCDYCPYAGVCGFETDMPGREYHKLENIKDKEEILARMRKEI